MALWRVVDSGDDDVTSTSSLAGCQSYTHWTAGLRTSSDDDDEDHVIGNLMWDANSEPTMKRLAAVTQHGRHRQPLQVPSYYHMKPMSVKPCEKAEKVRAFAYNDIRQVTTHDRRRYCNCHHQYCLSLHLFLSSASSLYSIFSSW